MKKGRKKKRLEYNHDRELESFKKELDILHSNRYFPIGVSYFHFEDVFIFETDEEAERAFQDMERSKGLVFAWWYDKPSFLAEVRKLEQDYYGHKVKIKVYWLNKL